MAPRHLSDGFREFPPCLDNAGVECLAVGGHAVARHGFVRSARAMAVWVAVSDQNAERLVQAVTKFLGTPLKEISTPRFLDTENVARFGAAPDVIEMLPKVSGIRFEETHPRRVIAETAGQKTGLICPNNLITSKRAGGRHKDMADLENPPEA